MTSLGAVASAAGQLIGGYFTPPGSGGAPPAQTQANGALSVIDWRDTSMVSVPADGTGIITLTFPEVQPGQVWLCDRYTVTCTSTTPTDAFVFIGSSALQYMRDVTASGNLDIADNNAALQVPGSRSLIFEWTGASLGAVAIASVQYRVLG